MGSATSRQLGPVQVLVSDDRLKAWVHVPDAGRRGTPPTATEIREALESAKITLTDNVQKRVDQFATMIARPAHAPGAESSPEIPEKYLIAEGRAPVDAQDGRFEWYDQFRRKVPDWQSAAAIDYYTRDSIRTVEANTAIGRLCDPTAGAAGVDVYGRDVPPRKTRGTTLVLGSGLRTAEHDPREVFTQVAGQIVSRGNRMSIEEVLRIIGDVNFDSGSVDACTDVVVLGTVRAHFSVRTTKSLNVDQAIEAAQVDVGGSATVRGGIVGDERSHLHVGGSLAARFCNDAQLQVGGDMRIDREIVNSTVRCAGRLVIENGAIIGSSVYAREGVEARVLGSEASVRTEVAVGLDPRVLLAARELEREARDRCETAGQIRERVAPLMANIKRLSPGQREQATELLARADEMELSVEGLHGQRKALLDDSRPKGTPQVQVHRLVYPGTRVLFGMREIVFDQPLHGPVRIEERKVQGATEIVAVNAKTGSMTLLPASGIDPKRLRMTTPLDGEKHESHETSPPDATG